MSTEALLEEWIFQVNASCELSFSESQGDVIPDIPKVSLLVSSSRREAPKNEETTCSRASIAAATYM